MAMALSTAATDPFDLLREWLLDDRAAGMPWTDADFFQRVDLACRTVPGSSSYRQPLTETVDAWRASYERMPSGALEQFGPSIGHSEPGERSSVAALG